MGGFGDLGEHFGGLEGSWEQVRILVDFESLSGTTQVERTGPGEGKCDSGVSTTNIQIAAGSKFYTTRMQTSKL